MIEKYFSAPKTLQRLRAGPSGTHIDSFADALEQQGYAPASTVRYLRAAAHLGCFVQRQGHVLSHIDASTLDAFDRHLSRCRCPHSNGGKTGYHARFGVKLFHRHLILPGICRNRRATDDHNHEPELVTAFRDWFRTHRGAAQPTLRLYSRGAIELLQALGEDVSQWAAQGGRFCWIARANVEPAPPRS